MSLTRLLFGRSPKKTIGSIEVDAFVRETHTRNSELTKYPVEDGTDISDHIINMPVELSVEGRISPAAVNLLQVRRQSNRHITAFEEINLLIDNKELVTVVTGLKTYDDMHIKSFNVDRNSSNGSVLDFTMMLDQARKVETQLTTVPNSQIGGDEVTELQAQSPADVGKTVDGQGLTSDVIEVAQGLLDGLLGAFGG